MFLRIKNLAARVHIDGHCRRLDANQEQALRYLYWKLQNIWTISITLILVYATTASKISKKYCTLNSLRNAFLCCLSVDMWSKVSRRTIFWIYIKSETSCLQTASEINRSASTICISNRFLVASHSHPSECRRRMSSCLVQVRTWRSIMYRLFFSKCRLESFFASNNTYPVVLCTLPASSSSPSCPSLTVAITKDRPFVVWLWLRVSPELSILSKSSLLRLTTVLAGIAMYVHVQGCTKPRYHTVSLLSLYGAV